MKLNKLNFRSSFLPVSRLHCESESFKMDLILDVNTQIYPVDLGKFDLLTFILDPVALALALTLTLPPKKRSNFGGKVLVLIQTTVSIIRSVKSHSLLQ